MLRLTIFVSVLAALAITGTLAVRSYKVVCYYSSWATYRWGNGKFTSDDIDPNACTHLVYAFGGLDNDFGIRVLDPWLSLNSQEGGGLDDFRKFTAVKSRNRNLKVLLGVGGWNEGSATYSQMAAVPRYRKAFIESALKYASKYGFDGINLDWHYPGSRGGIGSDKRNFITLMKEIREAFDANNLVFGISAAANIEMINVGYDVPEVTKYADYVSLLTYDYHGGWERKTGMNSPLYPKSTESSFDRVLNQDFSVQHWIKKGADKSKILLGLATYGRNFILQDPTKNRIGSSASRPGPQGRYTQQEGYLGYIEILERFNEEEGWIVEFDEEMKIPFAYNGNHWIGYDNERSFGLKADYIKKQGLGGAMVWSLETDDHAGVSGKRNPLINTLKDVLEDGMVIPTVPPFTGRPPTARPPDQSTAKPLMECKTTGSFQHPQDCTKYYTCIPGSSGLVPVVSSCPSGLAFDDTSKTCNWREAVDGCDYIHS